jgi:hypothetical protein
MNRSAAEGASALRASAGTRWIARYSAKKTGRSMEASMGPAGV